MILDRAWKIGITGGSGMLGSFLVEELLFRGFSNIVVVDDLSTGSERNLEGFRSSISFLHIDMENDSLHPLRELDFIFHLASRAFGIGYANTHDIEMLRHNNAITNNFFDMISGSPKIKGVHLVSSSCVYSEDLDSMPVESDWNWGFPEIGNAGYGWAKRTLEFAGILIQKSAGIEVTCSRPPNIYSERYIYKGRWSQALPSIVVKAMKADEAITIWGDGNQIRTYIHAKDCARAIVDLVERNRSNTFNAFNLPGERVIAMKDLADMVLRSFNRDLPIRFDTSAPSGNPNKIINAKKFNAHVPDFSFLVPFEKGIVQMCDWAKQI